jgi:hypothetical protein
VRNQWDQTAKKRRPDEQLVEGGVFRTAVGPTPTNEIANREVNQDQADDVGPDDVAGAVNRT